MSDDPPEAGPRLLARLRTGDSSGTTVQLILWSAAAVVVSFAFTTWPGLGAIARLFTN
ncbi:hypothetical protein [Streptomyces sp. NRRL B-24484]|uniref:hypothetical protein n=1 Tax=Streptomyces sp. NRRL B-24484 TaxID=1463833 RepID=UPI000A7CF904|nr:hypothetical protein [Streptomyces sp. NRRL B-24484]